MRIRRWFDDPIVAAALFVCVVALPCEARAGWERVWIPARDGVEDIMLEATLYRPPGAGPFPVVLLSHGATARGLIPPKFPVRPHVEASVFTRMGYAVVAPMRRGRGASGGAYAESYDCDKGVEGVERAIADTDAAVSYLKTLPFVDPSRVVLSGISRGGFLSVVYAARRPAGVRAVINFVGGWFGERCANSFTTEWFRKAAAATKIPMLWLYAENDDYFHVPSIKTFVSAFRQGGGDLQVRLYPSGQRHGHALPSYRDVWSADVQAFLKLCCSSQRAR